MTPVKILNRVELEGRRVEVLRECGMDEAALRQRAAEYLLTPEQAAALDELDRIDYLLGA